MVNLERLRASGCTQDRLKALFTNFEDPNTRKVTELLRDAMQTGIERNLRDYRVYWALDKAMNTPFYQASFTQLQGLIDSKPDKNKVLEMVNRWGLTHLLPNQIGQNGKTCCGPDGQPLKALNIPVFFYVLVPVVIAYVTSLWSRLFNDRNLTPFYKYEPAKFTKANRVRCEIITELMEMMSSNYGYRDDERQTILQTLVYWFCLKFPRESWHKVEHEDADGKLRIVKEGLRFHMPHPSRTFYDLFYRPSTINSDTGCRYMGYWQVVPYKDIRDNKNYWNTDRVSFGVNSWFTKLGTADFFATVYPCVLQFPAGPDGTEDMDRENAAAFYGTANSDAATLDTEMFYKLVPSDYGMGDYKYPVWFRFVLANDNAIVYCEPIPYTPGAFYGYNCDGNKAQNKSLALEVLPFQDLIGQTLSQWVLSVRQNLKNATFVNEDLVGKEVVDKLQNLGDKLYESIVWIPFSKTQNIALGDNEREAFYTPSFPRHDTAQLATLIKGILDILERVLGFSAQETGQAATHEQTAEEVRNISGYVASRYAFTGSYIDEGIFATKKMLYDAWIAYGSEEYTASISQNYAATEEEFTKLLENLGLDLDPEDEQERSAHGKRLVKGSKKTLEFVTFVSTRDASNRIDTTRVAAAMAQVFGYVANNPVLMQRLGTDQVIDLLNMIVNVSGLPKDFKLRAANPEASPEQQAQELQKQLLEFSKKVKEAIDASAQQTAQAVLQKTAEALQPVGQSIKAMADTNQKQDQDISELQAAVTKVLQVFQNAAQAPQMPMPNAPPPPPEYMTPPPDEMPANPIGEAQAGPVEEAALVP